MYRLFIDVPIETMTTEQAAEIANKIVHACIESNKSELIGLSVEQVNYRLGHDEDRQPRNYLILDAAGHAATKKSRINLKNLLDTESH
jgi:hypothetical protein